MAAFLRSYARIAYHNYLDCYRDALTLRQRIEEFLAKPQETTLASAREAWIKARASYGQSEVFRFYEGPIDFTDVAHGSAGPEASLNAWPLNEAFIDYVAGNAGAGIINDPSIPLNAETLSGMNQMTDEADVTMGYHAIEFLLWSQDQNADGPGQRPATDFLPDTETRQRRRTYLRLITDALVEDLSFLVDQWSPTLANNYAARFLRLSANDALAKVLTGIVTLLEFELASERLAVALDSGDQEDEHSCFSDNTHNDFVANFQGVGNIYSGQYGDYRGVGFGQLLAAADTALDAANRRQLETTSHAIENIGRPFDRVLAAGRGSPQQQQVEATIKLLLEQARLLKTGAGRLGVPVALAVE